MNVCNHVAFFCIDRIKQEHFYAKHFGFKRCRVFNSGKDDEFVLLKLGTMRFEFFSSPPEHLEKKAGEQPVGFRHFAFSVPDLELKIKELQADGLQPDDIINCDKAVKGLRICFFNDPEGNSIELMEGWVDDENVPELEG